MAQHCNGHSIYPYIMEFPFRALKTEKSFCPQGSLSEVQLALGDITDNAGNTLFVKLDRLINFDPDILNKPEKRPEALKQPIESLIGMLKNCRRTNLEDELLALQEKIKKKIKNEKAVVYNLSRHVLIPLFGGVELEKGYGPFLSKVGKLASCTVNSLGIGSVNTWHGKSELRIQGCDAISTPYPLNDEDEVYEDEVGEDEDEGDEDEVGEDEVYEDEDEGDEDEDEGDEDEHEVDEARLPHVISLDGKLKINERRHLAQLAATCVVNSFLERNLHPDVNPMVPTILFNRKAFLICLFDCKNDVLLISDPKLLSTRGGISRTGVLLLWLVVNHR